MNEQQRANQTPPHNQNNHLQDNAPNNQETTRHNDIQHNNWMEHANCKGATHLMFPRQHKDITYIPIARTICNNCKVKPQCLQYALQFPAGDMHGVWAGLTPRQLAHHQQQHGIKPTHPTLAQMWADLH